MSALSTVAIICATVMFQPIICMEKMTDEESVKVFSGNSQQYWQNNLETLAKVINQQIELNHPNTIDMLLKKVVMDPTTLKVNNVSLLHRAAYHGHLKVFTTLAGYSGKNYQHIKDNIEWTSLNYADWGSDENAQRIFGLLDGKTSAGNEHEAIKLLLAQKKPEEESKQKIKVPPLLSFLSNGGK